MQILNVSCARFATASALGIESIYKLSRSEGLNDLKYYAEAFDGSISSVVFEALAESRLSH